MTRQKKGQSTIVLLPLADGEAKDSQLRAILPGEFRTVARSTSRTTKGA